MSGDPCHPRIDGQADRDPGKAVARGRRLRVRQLGEGWSVSRLVVPAAGRQKRRKPGAPGGLDEAEMTCFASQRPSRHGQLGGGAADHAASKLGPWILRDARSHQRSCSQADSSLSRQLRDWQRRAGLVIDVSRALGRHATRRFAAEHVPQDLSRLVKRMRGAGGWRMGEKDGGGEGGGRGLAQLVVLPDRRRSPTIRVRGIYFACSQHPGGRRRPASVPNSIRHCLLIRLAHSFCNSAARHYWQRHGGSLPWSSNFLHPSYDDDEAQACGPRSSASNPPISNYLRDPFAVATSAVATGCRRSTAWWRPNAARRRDRDF